MLKYSLRLAILTLLLGGLYVSTANAGPHFSVQFGIGAPVAPGPYSGYMWQPGYYAWTGYGYQWVPGVWALPSYGQLGWNQYRWDHGRRDFYRDNRYQGGYPRGWNL